MRRINKDALKIQTRIEQILGHRNGYNGQLQRWRLGGGRQIDIAGCEQESDKQRFKGDPHDLIVFDEGTDFLESQYRFIIGWNRSTDPNQRCRVILTEQSPDDGGRPMGCEALGTLARQDTSEPRQAGRTTLVHDDQRRRSGSRWARASPIDGRTGLCPLAYLHSGNALRQPRSSPHGYAAQLAALPEELRRAYRDGDFTVGMKDAEFQVIPTSWVLAAEARWKPDGGRGLSMTAMALDPAGGGRDSAEIARRHGHWYAELISAKGAETADGSATAATVVKHRLDNAPIVVDVGGGYGGAVTLRLKDNDIKPMPFNGANDLHGKTKDGQLSFANRRAETWWRFREALDPDQPDGATIALPPDPELRADLCTPTWKLMARGILLESKEDIRKRLGRSPGKGDAVVMAWSEGNKLRWREHRRNPHRSARLPIPRIRKLGWASPPIGVKNRIVLRPVLRNCAP